MALDITMLVCWSVHLISHVLNELWRSSDFSSSATLRLKFLFFSQIAESLMDCHEIWYSQSCVP